MGKHSGGTLGHMGFSNLAKHLSEMMIRYLVIKASARRFFFTCFQFSLFLYVLSIRRRKFTFSNFIYRVIVLCRATLGYT